jgi:hypothetical protein
VEPSKTQLNKPIGDLQNLTPTEPFDIIGIDLVGPLPATDKHGYKYILVIQDLFSKWVEAFLIVSKDPKKIAELILNEVVSRFGAPTHSLRLWP